MLRVICFAMGALTGCGSLTYFGPVSDNPEGAATDAPEGTSDPLNTGNETIDPASEIVDIRLDSLEPTFGPNGGGLWVVLRGSFDKSTAVEVGGSTARVLQYEADELVIELPGTTATGFVDVEVYSADRSDTMTDGFQYWEDATGQAGTVGSVDFFQQVGGYWTPAPGSGGSGWFAFSSGTDWTLWSEYATTQGSCEFNYVSGIAPAALTTGAPQVQFGTQGGGFSLDEGVAKDLGADWYTGDLDSVLETAKVYDLEPVAGASNFPSFALPGAIEVVAPFQVTSPDMHGASLPSTDANIDLAWTGSGGDYVLIWILRQYVFNGKILNDGVVSCAVPDTGNFTVPAGVWDTWFDGDALHIQVGRVKVDSNVLPHNGADSRIAGVYWVWGGASTE